MNIDEFKAIVNQKKKENPIWFGLPSDLPPSNEHIKQIEDQLGAALPQEYKEFISEFGGGYFAFAVIYSMDKTSEFNIVTKNSHINEKDYIAFSDNGSGDYYGFEIKNGKCSSNIVFFDHETQEWLSTDYLNLFVFLERIALTN